MRRSSWHERHRAEDGDDAPVLHYGEATSHEREEHDDHEPVAQLWLPDPGERRGWALYHVWQTREQQSRRYGLNARRG